MNMKKTIKCLMATMCAVVMAVAAFALVGCDDKHTHTEGTDWAAYGDKHYHVCKDCDALVGDGVAHAAATGAGWKYDATQHWKECDECGAKIEVGQHDLAADSCTSDYIHEGKMGKLCSCGYFEASDTLKSYRTPVLAKQGTEKLAASNATSSIGDSSADVTVETVQLSSTGIGVNTLDLDFVNNKAKLKVVMDVGGGMKFTMIAATKEDCTEAMDAAMFMGLLIGEGTVAEATGGYTVTFNIPAHQADDQANPGQKVNIEASVIIFNVTKTGAIFSAVYGEGTTNTDLVAYFMNLTTYQAEPLVGAASFKSATVELELTWNMNGVNQETQEPEHKAPTFGELNKITSAKLTVKVDSEDDYVVENLTFDNGTFAFNPVNPLIQTVTYTGENDAGDMITVTISEDGTVSATVTACSKLTGTAALTVVAPEA